MLETIRKETFETNSSSCHTLTVTTTKTEVEEFNNNKRIYADLSNFGLGENFHKFEDVAKVLAETIHSPKFDDIQNSSLWSSFYKEDYVICDSCNSDEADQDFENLKEWMKVNFSTDMLEWAFTDKKDPKMFPIKSIIKRFICAWAEALYIGPLLTIKDFKDGGDGPGNTYVCKMDGSDAYWDEKSGKIVLYDYKELGYENPEKYLVELDFRD